MYGKGISREGSLLDVAVDLGIIKKSGAWFTYEGEQLGQGRENVKKFLGENLDLMIEISEKVRVEAGIDRNGDEPSIDLAEDELEDELESPTDAQVITDITDITDISHTRAAGARSRCT